MMDMAKQIPQAYTRHVWFWLGIAALLLAMVWVLQGVLLPFVLGFAIAYLLDPVVTALGRAGLNRTLATVIILGCFLLFVVGTLLAIGPIFYRELSQFADDLPAYGQQIEAYLSPYIDQLQAYIGKAKEDGFSGAGQYAGTYMQVSKTILGGVLAGGVAITGFVSLIVLTPLIAFFMMRDWPKMIEWKKGLIPMGYKETALDLMANINQKIAGFVRGQLTVAAILGLYYGIACSIAGLKYGLVIGLFAGLLNIVPMLGSIVGFVLGVSVAYLQGGDLVFVGIIAGIFLFGQIVEGNFLTPKLVGDSVGLHPLWVFFSLMAGGALLGITGMLIAVPVVASLGVLIGFALDRYKRSPYYLNGRVDADVNKKPKLAKKTDKTK